MARRAAYKLVDDIPDGEFKNLTRSTIPLLNFWQRGGRSQLADTLHLADLNGAEHEFEQATAVRGARGKPSMTDLLLRSDATAVAVEAKHTESRYETVNEWLVRGRDRRNRNRVLGYWLALLDEFCEHRVQPADVGDIVYQLVHRTASACRAAGARNAVVLYLLFRRPGARADHGTDLARLRDALRPSGRLRFVAAEVALTPTRALAEVETAAAGSSRPNAIIRQAVRDRALFEFGMPRIVIDTAP